MRLHQLIIFTLISTICRADSTDHKAIKILPVPAFGYSPETSTYIGAVSLFTIDLYNDSNTRTSNAKFEFNYTWRKQIIIETEWNYFFKNEAWFTKGRIHFSKFPDRYYGLGHSTPTNNEHLYSSNRVIAEAYMLKGVYNNLFTGPSFKYINYNGVTPIDQIKYPELVDFSSTGVGYTLLKDSRDNILTPSSGIYCNLFLGYVFNQKKYTEAAIDIRKYYTYKKITLAGRFYNEYNYKNPPFYDYAYLGGDKYVRGYYYGRYRDNNLSTLQLELRSIFIWRFGAAIFGGVSNVYNTFDSFNFSHTKYNAGAGLRFVINRKENVNLRIDYAVGEGNSSGFYISFGESF